MRLVAKSTLVGTFDVPMPLPAGVGSLPSHAMTSRPAGSIAVTLNREPGL